MPLLPRLIAESLLADSLRIAVRPTAVSLYADPPRTVGLQLGKRLRRSLIALGLPTPLAARPQHLCIALSRFSPRSHRWPQPEPIETNPKYAALADLARTWPDYRCSLLYQQLLDTLQQQGQARYYQRAVFCSSSDITRFFEQKLGPLIESLQREGYRQRHSDDTGTALIAADGSLVKSDKADHRFFLCRALGIAPLPLRLIAIHPTWLAARGLSRWHRHPADLQTALSDLVRPYR